jgi:hypothetical protein
MGLFVWPIGLDAVSAQTPPPAPLPPVARHSSKRLPVQPDMKGSVAPPQLSARTVLLFAGTSPWRQLTRQPPFNAGAMLLLTDGTLMVHDQGAKNSGSRDWWRLTPDVFGSYLNGTWSKLASLPVGYAPLYFACAVLADGRVIIEGGEYNNGQEVFTNLGAIYDPVKNTWTMVSPPSGDEWSRIGAAASTVLADGTFMIGGTFTNEQALFNPVGPSWTITGAGKADGNEEETWTLLPNGNVLTVDANNTKNLTNSELYLPGRRSWISGGSTIVKLPDINSDNSGSHEMGPQLLLPDGTVFAAGATGNTSVFSSVVETSASTFVPSPWTPAPAFPLTGGLQYTASDSSAALLPSGKVLVVASPGVDHQPPAHFFLFDGKTKTLLQIAGPPNAESLSSYYGYMIVLPTGQVMFNSRLGDIELYTDTESITGGTAPTIAKSPTSLVAGTSYPLSGIQLNGVSQAAAYAEGYQSATNYPLVRIVNVTTKHVFYARTFGHSGMGVTHGAVSSTNFTVPARIETGPAMLYAVANGIASNPISVTVGR